MSCVHYKFSSKLNYSIITFDGRHISLFSLKKQIMEREKLKAANSDLQILNAETKEEYTDDNALIPKYSSVIVRRIPVVGAKSKSKTYHRSRTEAVMGTRKAVDDSSAPVSLTQLIKTSNLAEANASEEDKIKAMMIQSGHLYNPIDYMKETPVGLPPPSYTCFRFGKPGHYISNCPTNSKKNFESRLSHYISNCPTNSKKNFESRPRIKRSTGIPTSFMMEVKDPNMKGAMLTSTGKYAIPTINAEAYATEKKEKPPFLPEEPSSSSSSSSLSSSSSEAVDPIPEELLCLICKDSMTDAAIIPCCGNSYCDECIRTALLESDEHTCPTCHQKDVSPDALVANRVLRQAVNNFKNQTGYTKRLRKQVTPPTINAEAYATGKKEKPPFSPEEPSSSSSSEEVDPIPDELWCLICKDSMTDAVIIPCCGNSYCDACIRRALLESDEHTCPTCHQKDVSPDALVANQVLRQAVNNFKNQTGYTKRLRKQVTPSPPPLPPPSAIIQWNLQPPMESHISSQQDPVTSSSAHPTPSATSLASNSSSLAPSVPGNPSPAPAPVPDTTARVSVSGHSEKSDGPFRDSDNKLSPAAALTSQHSKGASSIAVTALMEEKGCQVPVLGTPPLLGQSLLHGQFIPTTGPVRINAARPGGGRPGWEHSNKLGSLSSPPQQIRREERSRNRGIKRGLDYSEPSQRTQGPSRPATPVSVPVPPPLLQTPPPHMLPFPPGVAAPQFPPQFPPGQPPAAGYSVPPPGFPPAPAKISTAWVSSGVQTAHSNTIPTTQALPLSREEFYRVQQRLREECKFPYSGSSYSRSSHTYSKSRSGSIHSHSYSQSFSRSHPPSSSGSPPSPRRGRGQVRNDHCSWSRSHGYHRSRSRSPPYRRYHSRSRSPPDFRGQSPTKLTVPQGEKELYQEWERTYRQWYENRQRASHRSTA